MKPQALRPRVFQKLFFFVFAIPSLFAQELPGIFFEQKPESFSFSAEGDYKLTFFLDPAKEPVDLAIGVIPDKDKSSGAIPVLVNINGALYGKYNTSPKEFKTLRVPRLFLKPGANLLTIEINKAAFKEGKTASQFRPLVFPSHKMVDKNFPGAKSSPPSLELFGEAIYSWNTREVRLWVSALGTSKAWVDDLQGGAELAGKSKEFKKSSGDGASALELAAKSRFETIWSFDELENGVNPVKVVAVAKGYSQTVLWFPLKKSFGRPFETEVSWSPAKDAGLKPRNVQMTFKMSAFHEMPEPIFSMKPTAYAFLPEKTVHFMYFLPGKTPDPSPPKGTVDYGAVMNWIREVKNRGGLVFLDRSGKDIRENLEDFSLLLDFDGLVCRDASGFDKCAEPGGLWDGLLSQRRRIGILGLSGTSLLRIPAEGGEAGLLEGMRAGARSVGEGETRIEISLSQARSGGQASLAYGEKGELVVSASGSFSELLVVGEKEGLPGAILASLKTSGKYSFEATRPTYFRAIARTDGVTKAVSAPIFLDVRPAFRDRTALRLGQVALFKDPGKGAVEKLEYSGKDDFFPLTLGAEACKEALIPFSAKEEGSYYLEIGLDPGKQCQRPEEKLEVFLEGKNLGSYRSDNPIQGIKVQHLIPFRIPLGKWAAHKSEKIRLVSSAPGDGIGIAYAWVIRSSFPFMALADSHAHSKAEDDFSDKLHRTMGYNYISTAHGQLPDTARRQQALALAEKLTDSQMILQIGGERGDRFGANHVSIAFHQPSFEDYDRRDDNYSSGIALGLQWKGSSIINHPDNDSRLSWVRNQFDSPWGFSEPYYHGYAGYSHHELHQGYADFYWSLMTHFEYFNGYGTPGVASGRDDNNGSSRTRWHEELGRYVQGVRRAPIFGNGSTDTKTFQQKNPATSIAQMYTGTYLHCSGVDFNSMKSAFLAGNSVIACHADTRLVVFLEDSQKNLYLPGNQILGTGPYVLHVEAWSPRGLASVRAVGPSGVISQRPLSGTHIDEDLPIELGPMDWVIVEIRGSEPYTGAIANAFLRTEF